MKILFQSLLFIGAAALVCVPSSRAQPGGTDLTFAPGSRTDGPVYAIAVQGDGKIMIGGSFGVVDQEVRGRIARLNAAGTVDTGFGAGLAGVNGTVWSLAIQNNGKVLIAGEFTSVNGVPRSRIARLNTDGSLDTSFGDGLLAVSETVRSLVLLTNGQILIGGDFTTVYGVTSKYIARLNADGSLDTTFESGVSSVGVYSVAVQSDGRVVIGGDIFTVDGATRFNIARLHMNGTLDTSFGNGLSGANAAVRSVVVQTNGQILIGGDFLSVNGVTRRRIARLSTDGTLDTNFLSGAFGAANTVRSVAAQTDGQVLIGGAFTIINGTNRNYIARLGTDGSVDTNFVAGPDATVHSVAVQSDRKLLIGGDFGSVNGVMWYGIARLNENGSRDTGFGTVQSGVSTGVNSLAVQNDGKVLIGGAFTNVNGINRNYIARLGTDGSLDTGFLNDLGGANGPVNSVALQDDGRFLIGGSFTNVNSVPRNRIARLNPDGTLDTTFLNGLGGANGNIHSVAVQTNGQVLIVGDFTTVNGAARTNIARLNADGSRDPTFVASSDAPVFSVVIQSDAKILIGGAFSIVNGTNRNRIARLNTNGSLDTGFGSGLPAVNGSILSVVAQANGQVLIGGSFFTNAARGRIARLNTDGSLDSNFLAGANGTVYSVAMQKDGKILVGGDFTSVNGTNQIRIARLHPNGLPDTGFGNALSKVNGRVSSVAVSGDAKVVIGGTFTAVNDAGRRNVARLYGDSPPFSIARSGTANVLLSWPVGWNGFVLQQTALLPSPWIDVAQAPMNNGTNWFIAIPTTNASEFYRLRK